MNRNREFEAFFRSTKDQLFRSLIVVAGERFLAEEAALEAYARALERWHEVRLHPTPYGWIARTAVNYVRSHNRATWRTTDQGDTDVPIADDPPSDPELLRQLLALPGRQREVVALRIVLDLDARETADVLGIAEGTVGVHLFRALARLREELSQIAPKEAWL